MYLGYQSSNRLFYCVDESIKFAINEFNVSLYSESTHDLFLRLSFSRYAFSDLMVILDIVALKHPLNINVVLLLD
ncbi:hypothetical protein RSP781_07985 [Ralstonia pseudosolanacearum]|nr:hypothetical protein RSP781_07985 [Ralstonia pseudosolanacearum]